jgi:hypothetical protein
VFSDWGARGGWADGYGVFAMVADNHIIGTVGRQSMRYVINDNARSGYQIGSYSVCEPERARLLSAIWVSQARARPFHRACQSESYEAACADSDITRPTDRAWLADHCGRAGFVGQGFAARDYYPVLLFHLTCQPRTAFRLESFGAVVIARQDGERLLIDDLLATRPFSLRDALPHVCRHPVRTVEFGFHPEAWWQDAESLSFDDDGAPLVTPQCQMDHQLRMPIAVTVHRVRAALEALGIEFLDITRDRASASACRASAPQTWVFRGRELLRTLSAATGGFIEGRRG